MNRPSCHTCKRDLRAGESAWASDWKVIPVAGEAAAFHMETRYSCDDCEGAA